MDHETPESDLNTGRKPSALSILKYTLWGGLIGFLYHFAAIAVFLAAAHLRSMNDNPGDELFTNLVLWHFALSPTAEPNTLFVMGWMLSGLAGLVAGGTIGAVRWLLARIPGKTGDQ